MKILFFKRKVLVWMLIIVLLCVSVAVFFGVRVVTAQPAVAKTIVIDAGHGGIDGGAEGKQTGVYESDLNLKYALTLKKICEEFGYRVVLTRSDMGGLYSPTADNKKKSEMQKREEIIRRAKPDFVVSLHMNSFSMSSTRGAHVFYAKDSVSGKTLAESVANSLFDNVEYAHKEAKVGDYYVLNCTSAPSVLVECGFLSNPEEELLLQQEEYQNKFCYYIFCGILLYQKTM